MRSQAAIFVFAATLPAWLCGGCVSRFFYYPTGRLYQTPERMQLRYEQVFFRSGDGILLNGWYVPSPARQVFGTVLHVHGNAQNMSAHFSYVHWLPAEGFNLFLFDYRGYGFSEGTPSRTGVYEDTLAALRYLQSRTDLDTNRIVILGQSLGGANAIAVVGRQRPAGVRALAVDSSFYSYRSIVRDKLALVPVLSWFRYPLSWLVVGNRYSPSRIAAPRPCLSCMVSATGSSPFITGNGSMKRPDNRRRSGLCRMRIMRKPFRGCGRTMARGSWSSTNRRSRLEAADGIP